MTNHFVTISRASRKGSKVAVTKAQYQAIYQQVINNALTHMAQQKGKLIDKPNLKQAMNYWRNSTYRLGLTGQISPHSLRYAFTQEQVDQYLKQGYSEQETLAKALILAQRNLFFKKLSG